MWQRRTATRLIACAAALLSLPAGAQPRLACAAQPGTALLRIETAPAPAPAHHCDAAALQALPQREITTALPAELELAGRHRWQGVSLRDLLARAGAQRTQRVRLKALNDYAIDIPWSDLEQFDPILAMRRNGAPLSVRDKGPLMLIYPFDSDARLRAHEYLGRSIWQVDAIQLQ